VQRKLGGHLRLLKQHLMAFSELFKFWGDIRPWGIPQTIEHLDATLEH
jgi:hypothetical protein